MRLPVLYHWSPTERRKKIRDGGLKPYARTRSNAEEKVNLGFPYVCLSTTPSLAWALSGDIADETEYDAWDLWTVDLAEGDEVVVMPEFGTSIKEVRVRTAIPADRVWYAATRTSPTCDIHGRDPIAWVIEMSEAERDWLQVHLASSDDLQSQAVLDALFKARPRHG